MGRAFSPPSAARLLGLTVVLVGTAAPSAAEGLAARLFDEGDPAACRRELLREDPLLETERARLLFALCAVDTGRATAAAAAELEAAVARANADLPLAAAGQARLFLAEGNLPSAAAAWMRVFFAPGASPGDVMRAACCLRELARRGAFGEDGLPAAVRLQVDAVRSRCPPGLAAESRRLVRPEPRAPPLPARALLRFYRSQVGPAIGARCALEPSCSAYFAEAAARYGPLALPLLADRFVREPSTVAERRRTVRRGGATRVLDPLADHTAPAPTP